MSMEKCNRCREVIDKLSTPYLIGEEIICIACHSLAKSPAKQQKFQCPMCGCNRPPTKKPRANMEVAGLLLLIGIIPGLIYMAAMSGDVFICPQCKAKRGTT